MRERTLYILIAVLLLCCLWLGHRAGNLQDKVSSQNSVIDEQNASIEEIELENGLIASEKIRAIADRETLLESYHFLEDSLKQLGIKAKELESALFVSTKTTGTGTGRIDTLLIQGESDTVYVGRSLNIRENFFGFNATIYPDDTYSYDYMVYDSLALVDTKSRKNIFSPWEYKVTAVSSNPSTRITGVTSMTIREKMPRHTVSVFVGYGASTFGLSPIIGIGVGRTIVRF